MKHCNLLFGKPLLLSLVLIVLSPYQSLAYVDPGLIGSFYQILYFIFFGVILAYLTAPFQYMKSLFRKVFCGKDKDIDDTESNTSSPSKTQE